MQLCQCPGQGPHSPSGPHNRSPLSPGLHGTMGEILSPARDRTGGGQQAPETELAWTCQTGQTLDKKGRNSLEIM